MSEALPDQALVELIIKYQSKEFKRVNENCSDGCCVYCGEHACERMPSRKLIELTYVDEDDSEDRKRTNCINKVLMGMKNGLLLEYDRKDNCLYARRRCSTVVYYHSSQYHQNSNPVKIESNQRVKIFDYPSFKKQFIAWLTAKMDRQRAGETEPFKRPKIFFSFGQTWQPYLEKHKELGENRPQPTSLDTRLVSMTIVPLAAKEMVMSTTEGRESSKTISMGFNEHFFFFSLEASSHICNSLEKIAENCKQKIDERQNSREMTNDTSTDQKDSSYDKLLNDCLDLCESIENRKKEISQKRISGNEQSVQNRTIEHQQPMEQEYQVEQQQGQHTEQQKKAMVDFADDNQQHFTCVQHHQVPHVELKHSGQQVMNHVPFVQQSEVGQASTSYATSLTFQPHQRRHSQHHHRSLRFRPYPQSNEASVNQSAESTCDVSEDGTVYFNWGNGTEEQVALTAEEWYKLVKAIEVHDLMPK